MNVIYERCCGMDVHKNTIVACVITGKKKDVRNFNTMTSSLLSLVDWLKITNCQCVDGSNRAILEANLQSLRNGGDTCLSC